MAQHSKPGASGTSKRGFASMDPALQREIASKGGRSVPPEERSFSKDRALAAQAGRKGGEASHGLRRGDAAARPGRPPKPPKEAVRSGRRQPQAGRAAAMARNASAAEPWVDPVLTNRPVGQ